MPLSTPDAPGLDPGPSEGVFEAAFAQQRVRLRGHCYRMLGSPTEAEDAVQETLVRAWRARERFEGRAAVSTWLYRIATRVCLDALADRKRREQPMALRGPGTEHDALEPRSSETWIEPIPDALVVPADADPAEQLLLRERIRLAFVAALQHLPPKQRAALLSTEVLGWSAKETAACLDTSVASVNSAVQRAREKLARAPAVRTQALSDSEAQLVDQYVAAFERYDVDALTAIMREDTVLSMPPFDLWLQGPARIRGWLEGRGAACRGSVLVPTAANGQPAFGHYKPDDAGVFRPWAITVLEVDAGSAPPALTAWHSFLDVARLFPIFDLPDRLDR